MDSTPVNWEALDALVIEFAKSENLFLENDAASSSPSLSPPSSPASSSLSPPPPPTSSSPSSSSSCSSASSSYQSRLLIRRIRRLLEFSDVDSALDLLRLHAPSILDDHRLLFCLQKQKFIELLRRGTPEDLDSAIQFLRNSLVPSALNAYPEAYEEFKHVLLALIYDKDDSNSPVSSEWSEKRRFEIAGLVSSILRAHLQAHDPLFSMTLRYLISIHKEFCLRQGVSSPISDLTERLLLEDKDAPATPQESLFEVPPFDEVDIQALAHAVQLTRQGAVDSLRFAKGDLLQAFQNEVCRMRMNVSILDELVREYCIYRGIVDPAVPSSGSRLLVDSGHMKANKSNATGCLSMGGSHDVDCGNSKNSDDGSSISNAHVDGTEISTDMISMQDTDVEMRFPSDSAINHDDCSTSGTRQPKTLKFCHRIRGHAVGEGRRRKRWRERNDDSHFSSDMSHDCSKREASEKHSPSNLTYNKEDRHESFLSIKDLADEGMAAEVVEAVNALDPEFFGHNTVLLFQLKQVEFLKLVDSGDYSGALKVACSHLGPLAANDPDLLRPLKETLLALLRPNEVSSKREMPLHALASSLQVAIGRRFDIEEPQLVKVIQATLHTHKEWFKLQMCKDRFESFLKIDALKEVKSLLMEDTISKSNVDAYTQGSSQATISTNSGIPEDDSPSQVSSQEVCDESAILKVMEFVALPRADAIHLLAQYNGDAETVIQQIFA